MTEGGGECASGVGWSGGRVYIYKGISFECVRACVHACVRVCYSIQWCGCRRNSVRGASAAFLFSFWRSEHPPSFLFPSRLRFFLGFYSLSFCGVLPLSLSFFSFFLFFSPFLPCKVPENAAFFTQTCLLGGDRGLDAGHLGVVRAVLVRLLAQNNEGNRAHDSDACENDEPHEVGTVVVVLRRRDRVAGLPRRRQLRVPHHVHRLRHRRNREGDEPRALTGLTEHVAAVALRRVAHRKRPGRERRPRAVGEHPVLPLEQAAAQLHLVATAQRRLRQLVRRDLRDKGQLRRGQLVLVPFDLDRELQRARRVRRGAELKRHVRRRRAGAGGVRAPR
eukprot:Rhum_TRINITY_DN482_c0_g1::Rhum_TRINITY_DN482_c0_g1_i1::g.1470::m.1470